MLDSFCMSLIVFHTEILVCGSNPVVGSSKKSIFGLFMSALAMSALLFCPPDSFPYRLFIKSSHCVIFEASLILSFSSFPLSP